ncbi:MAG TPA: AAA family ATPase [Bryobacteraceae bacterium]|nr:AAA family ATPase [Bryobacteraceae bacterium]
MTQVKRLTPAQQRAARNLLRGLEVGEVIVLEGEPGTGKTTILEEVHRQAGGVLLGVRQFLVELISRGPAAIEEAFLAMLDQALAGNELVLVDDLHLVTNIVDDCEYPRSHLLDAALTAVLAEAAVQGKKILFATDGEAPWPVKRRAITWEIRTFTADDYRCLCEGWLDPQKAEHLDYARLHRFAPMLNAYQLKHACAWMGRKAKFDTDRMIDYLKSQNLTSNVAIEEVARVDWNELKGVDDVIHALETKIALPFENDALATRFGLKPKRGVLLAGPPGTGKTTIGRALAHRLKGKFFLIDGTMVAGSRNFHSKVDEVFESATKNAPAVIFIDDADVIFEGNEERGFYRYLLTKLDGLESASAQRVCVMMTAMNVSSLPHALVRSGRVELWLETRLPGPEARASILDARLSGLPEPVAVVEVGRLVSASRGLTGADLQAVVEDGKLVLAHDLASGKTLRPVEDYFLEAIETVRANQMSYARRRPAGLTQSMAFGFAAELCAKE